MIAYAIVTVETSKRINVYFVCFLQRNASSGRVLDAPTFGPRIRRVVAISLDSLPTALPESTAALDFT